MSHTSMYMSRSCFYIHSHVCHTCLHTFIPPQRPWAQQLGLTQAQIHEPLMADMPTHHAHTHTWIYTHRHADQCTLIVTDLHVPPCAHYHLSSVCFIVHNKHANSYQTHTSARQGAAQVTPSRTGVCPPAPTGDRTASRHPSSHSHAGDHGADHSQGTASHSSHVPRPTGTHTVTRRASRGCPPPLSPQQPRALIPLGGTFLREPLATWLPLEQKRTLPTPHANP